MYEFCQQSIKRKTKITPPLTFLLTKSVHVLFTYMYYNVNGGKQ